MSVSKEMVTFSCDGGCNRGGHYSQPQADVLRTLAKAGWVVLVGTGLPHCYCPECVQKGKDKEGK